MHCQASDVSVQFRYDDLLPVVEVSAIEVEQHCLLAQRDDGAREALELLGEIVELRARVLRRGTLRRIRLSAERIPAAGQRFHLRDVRRAQLCHLGCKRVGLLHEGINRADLLCQRKTIGRKTPNAARFRFLRYRRGGVRRCGCGTARRTAGPRRRRSHAGHGACEGFDLCAQATCTHTVGTAAGNEVEHVVHGVAPRVGEIEFALQLRNLRLQLLTVARACGGELLPIGVELSFCVVDLLVETALQLG